jgi:hypothetical protein
LGRVDPVGVENVVLTAALSSCLALLALITDDNAIFCICSVGSVYWTLDVLRMDRDDSGTLAQSFRPTLFHTLYHLSTVQRACFATVPIAQRCRKRPRPPPASADRIDYPLGDKAIGGLTRIALSSGRQSSSDFDHAASGCMV